MSCTTYTTTNRQCIFFVYFQFAVLLYLLTYIGAQFNFLTLCILCKFLFNDNPVLCIPKSCSLFFVLSSKHQSNTERLIPVSHTLISQREIPILFHYKLSVAVRPSNGRDLLKTQTTFYIDISPYFSQSANF